MAKYMDDVRTTEFATKINTVFGKKAAVDQNTADIATNTADIAQNASDIATLQATIGAVETMTAAELNTAVDSIFGIQSQGSGDGE